MKKLVNVLAVCLIAAITFASCGSKASAITVISRESGSGTRSAFVELMGITDADGNDITYNKAEISNSTSVVISTVAGNKNAIGYISLGSLGDSVKTVKLEGVEATVDNVKSGSYKLSRQFNVAYKDGKLSEAAQDFVKYIMSADGQKIISDAGYIAAAENRESYTTSGLSGKVTLAGSTSVAPVMGKIADAYQKLNSGITVEIQESGSSAGITSASEDAVEIAMSSRELKDDEAKILKAEKIAIDGIAVIVNKDNTVETLTTAQIQSIFKGETTKWDEVA